MVDPAVVVAAIAAIPATVAAWNSRKTHREVQTNHGMRAGEYAELTNLGVALMRDDMSRLRTDFHAHTETDKTNFEAIQRQLEDARNN